MIDNNTHNILKTKHLSIGYQTKKATSVITDNINLELKKGELIGLVGANGIGKSTLLRTLSMIQKPLEGLIEINDIPLENYTALELAKTMSLVLTEQLMSKNLSVEELVALGRQPYTNWVGNLSELYISAVHKAIDQNYLSDIKHRKRIEWNERQLQKAMIARALAQNTDLIIVDEPTTQHEMHHKANI